MFGWIENAINQIGGWFGQDLRSPSDRNTDQLARDNYDLQKEYFEHQKEWDQRNYEEQRRQYEQNFGFTQEKFDYDKALQETMFNREDTAVQRRTADLKAAGINPILAAGQAAGSGPVVSTTAPYGEAAQKENTAKTPDISGVMANEMRKQAKAQMVMNALKMASEISHTKADTERIKQQTRHDEVRLEHEGSRLHLDFDRYNLELDRLGVDIISVGHSAQRVILETSRVELEEQRLVIEKNRYNLERILTRYRAENINAQTATEELRQLGLKEDIIQQALQNDITAHDLELSVLAGIRHIDRGQNIGVGMATGHFFSNLRDRITGNQNSTPTTPRRESSTNRDGVGTGRNNPARRR